MKSETELKRESEHQGQGVTWDESASRAKLAYYGNEARRLASPSLAAASIANRYLVGSSIETG